MTFPVSGVETPIWVPPLVACVISYFTSMAGVSGAFLLLPFQMSVLGFVSPAVSSTNLVFNVCGIPGGVYRYLRERRLIWPLTLTVVAGSVPGVLLGAIIRVRYLPDPRTFKVFVGIVLLYLGVRLLMDIVEERRATRSAGPGAAQRGESDSTGAAERGAVPSPAPNAAPVRNQQPAASGDWQVEIVTFTWRRLQFVFRGQEFGCSLPLVFVFALVVGVIGGVYGIGGGAIVAPFLVGIFRLPVHTIAGATLMGTFLTSVAGVLFYQLVVPTFAGSELVVAPDWLLGGLFGLGGIAGMYLGARTQRFVPALVIKVMLMLILLFVAVRYLRGLFG